MIICEPDEIVVGMQVSGNHISSAHEGDTVRAVALSCTKDAHPIYGMWTYLLPPINWFPLYG